MSDYKYFENWGCQYYPCHKDNHINCLFCFCPLYDRGDCGGNFKMLPNGKKDCSECLYPHKVENYDRIIQKLMR